jgi:hypothetical protein
MGDDLALLAGIDGCFAAVERLATTTGPQLGTTEPAGGRRFAVLVTAVSTRRVAKTGLSAFDSGRAQQLLPGFACPVWRRIVASCPWLIPGARQCERPGCARGMCETGRRCLGTGYDSGRWDLVSGDRRPFSLDLETPGRVRETASAGSVAPDTHSPEYAPAHLCAPGVAGRVVRYLSGVDQPLAALCAGGRLAEAQRGVRGLGPDFGTAPAPRVPVWTSGCPTSG